MEEQRVDTEKITINLTPVDLGKVDLVVQQGVFSTRTDFIRTAIRRELERLDPMIQEVVVRNYWSVGAEFMNRRDLEKKRANKEKLSIRVIGLLVLDDDVTPELADEVLNEVSVLGSFRAPKPVLERLGSKIIGRRAKRLTD